MVKRGGQGGQIHRKEVERPSVRDHVATTGERDRLVLGGSLVPVYVYS